MKERVPSARPITTAVLRAHALRFHKRSVDGSGKADAYATGHPADVVWGVVYEIDGAEKGKLDKVEGLGSGYAEKTVAVEAPDGAEHEAEVYFATNIDTSLVPYGWYKRYVLEGARQQGLPDHYVDGIEAQESQNDPDQERACKHLAVEC